MSVVRGRRVELVAGVVLGVVASAGLLSWARTDPPSRPAIMVMPAVTFSYAPPSSPPALSASPSASVSRSPVPTRRVASPAATSSRKPSRSPSVRPSSRRPSFEARVTVASSRGFVGGSVGVEGSGSWTLVLDMPGVRVTTARGASVSVSGSTATFKGSGSSVRFFGYVESRRDLGPVSCRISNGTCAVTARGIPE